MRFSHLLLGGVSALAFAGTAQAAQFKGWYVGIEGGANWVSDVDVLYTRTFNDAFATSDTADAAFGDGWTMLATVGYAFSNQLRVEVEGGFRSNDVAATFFVSSVFVTMDGDLDEFSLMANVLYDVPLGERATLSLGGGAGADQTKLDVLFDDARIREREWHFAAQGIAGLSYTLTPGIEATLTYRYLHVGGPTFAQQGFFSIIPFTDTFAFDDLSKHSLTFGLRFDLWSDAAKDRK
jgi:OmpA-OmpF porin, OOP family